MGDRCSYPDVRRLPSGRICLSSEAGSALFHDLPRYRTVESIRVVCGCGVVFVRQPASGTGCESSAP